MTDWQEIIDADYALPDDRPLADLVAELSVTLRSPDPVLRDDHAYQVLARWIPMLEPEDRDKLGDELASRFADPEIQARTFAPLMLSVVVAHGGYRESWVEAFAAWYPAETDLRGHDAELGWLHAVAHGADLLRVLGGSPFVEKPAALLDLAVARMLAPTTFVWSDQEDDRLAYALGMMLTRPELTEEQCVGWLTPVADLFDTGEPGPVPANAVNTMRTLRLLYLLADRGVRARWGLAEPVMLRHREAVKERLAEVLAIVAPFAG